MKRLMLILIIITLFSSGCKNLNMETNREKLKLTDIEFSSYSMEHGMNKAFVTFAADKAVLLKPKRMPIVGLPEIIDYHNNSNDKEIILSWNPDFVDLAESGELGYTYGFWKLTNQKDSLLNEGTYVTIWKKQDDGSWKYILDSGNSGLK